MWKNYNGKIINNLEDEIVNIIKKSNNNLKIIVGTDSQVIDKRISFVTAIVFWSIGHGGHFIYLKEYQQNIDKLKVMQNRLFRQAVKSVQIANKLQEILKKYSLKVDEIHLDVNSDKKHKSSRIAPSCVGYVKWCGFQPKIKPQAFVASVVADYLTR